MSRGTLENWDSEHGRGREHSGGHMAYDGSRVSSARGGQTDSEAESGGCSSPPFVLCFTKGCRRQNTFVLQAKVHTQGELLWLPHRLYWVIRAGHCEQCPWRTGDREEGMTDNIHLTFLSLWQAEFTINASLSLGHVWNVVDGRLFSEGFFSHTQGHVIISNWGKSQQ